MRLKISTSFTKNIPCDRKRSWREFAKQRKSLEGISELI